MRSIRLIQEAQRCVESQRRPRRSGTTVLEIVVGTIILGVFISGIVPVFRWMHVSKSTNERHFVAMQELSTRMERLSAMPVTEIDEQYLQSLRLSESTQSLLQDAELTATMTREDQTMLRVSLALSWTNNAGRPVAPKRLTAWFPLEADGGTE